MFVVRYDDDSRNHLAQHTDDSDISFNVLLSDDFDGGGTRFWSRLTGLPFATVKPKRIGQVLIHSALVRHEGLPVTRGTRYILVGFLAVDRIQPLTATTTDSSPVSTKLSWFASWFSLSYWHVKLKVGYTAAHSRREKRLNVAGHDDNLLAKKKAWTEHKYIRSLIRDLVYVVEYVGDILCPHRYYNLVSPEKTDAYLESIRMKRNSIGGHGEEQKATWYAGQQLDLDLDGTVYREWSTRKEKDVFHDL
eukprot:CAMPEP_0202441692 /NCGR_PEP_ID=MMETSP1360-20130828/1195_1 /ASSEMBLY_ACC=CAM_ASM_000848 /TAXON_ID=515479 /ORGANISM="Licmophora paradoxa, Strain CCMP2313" /LENGTH=248 /DNA_ID=CAMNT_0049056783 /DNA_START=323 /DNA_END=1069 /DNA_ORIENTATION=+